MSIKMRKSAAGGKRLDRRTVEFKFIEWEVFE